jgi:hypothetical protein
MSHYIRQAMSFSAKAFYIGKTRKDPLTQRGEPSNKSISKFIQDNGEITWKIVMTIPDHQLHPEFGEAYLINCFKKKLSHLTLLNKNSPHEMALDTYDNKSESFINKLGMLLV